MSFRIGHYSNGFIYLIFSLSKPTAVFAVECQSWLNVARLWGKVHAWSTQVSSFNPNDCVKIFQPSQAMSSVCMCFFVCRAECFTGVHSCENIVECPPGPCVGGNKKRSIITGTSSCRMEIKRTGVTFLPALAKVGGHWTIWNHVSIVGILLCEIKYRYCGLWWMERVSQISVTSTLKTFPKWPYKEFLKRCLLRIKRSNWWKTEGVNLNFFFYFSFTSRFLLWF